VGDGLHQCYEFLAARRLDPTEPGSSIEVIDVHTILKQHVKVDVQVAIKGSMKNTN
jgi:hypothetical protein